MLGANSAYLVSIRLLGGSRDSPYQNYFYQYISGAPGAGLVLVLPFVVLRVAHQKPTTARTGAVRNIICCSPSAWFYWSRVALMRIEGFELKNPNVRSLVIGRTPSRRSGVWLYILHRLAGRRSWRVASAGRRRSASSSWGWWRYTRRTRANGTSSGRRRARVFYPRRARPRVTPSRRTYDGRLLPEVSQGLLTLVPQRASLQFVQQQALHVQRARDARSGAQRDGNVMPWLVRRCHDVAVFQRRVRRSELRHRSIPPRSRASRARPATDREHQQHARQRRLHVGRSITVRFQHEQGPALLNEQLVKGSRSFTRRHSSPLHERGVLLRRHKVNSARPAKHKFLGKITTTVSLSGVGAQREELLSGQGQDRCADCHMPLKEPEDFGANFFNPTNQTTRFIHDHLFPAANTGVAHIRGRRRS